MKLFVKLQRDEEGQFVCIPTEFDFPGDDVVMRKQGDRIVIEPVLKKKSLVELLDEWQAIDEDFPEV